jgi:hypothetical protein
VSFVFLGIKPVQSACMTFRVIPAAIELYDCVCMYALCVGFLVYFVIFLLLKGENGVAECRIK